MQRTIAAELMDDPHVDVRELAKNFDDIERANRYFGGTRPVLAQVLARGASTVLDVGCGSGDVARALLHGARSRGESLAIVALDSSDVVLRIARARTGDDPSLRFVLGDGAALPFADASFDVAICTLALHHFEPVQAVALLRELRRVARRSPVVCDLERSRLGLAAALLFARFVARNRLTKHDAPLSVKRAYTRREAHALAARAGWKAPSVRRYPFFRMVLTDDA